MGYVHGEVYSHYNSVSIHLYMERGVAGSQPSNLERAREREPQRESPRERAPRERAPLLSEEWYSFIGEGESSLLVVFQCGTPLTLFRVVTCGNTSLAKVMTSQSMVRG
ncbi:unnamed protein product [Prunus brigantina]